MKTLSILLTASLCFTLSACTPAAPNVPPPSSAEASSETAGFTAAIAEYQARITELQAALLSLKEESFINSTEYEKQIAALTAEIAALEAKLSLFVTPESTADLPVSGAPQKPPASATESQKPTAMAFHYEIRDGRAVILSYPGDEPRVTVPAVIEGYPVTAIADSAFQGTSITEVEIPYSVSEIGWFAFADCPGLMNVTLPASVEAIGYGAFDGCQGLTIICPADSYAAEYAASFGILHTEK